VKEGVEQLVADQMTDVQAQHPNLELLRDPGGALHVCGEIGFTSAWNSRVVEDTYQVEIRIPEDYPESPPTAFETGAKIATDFEHFMEDGSLCLGAPVGVRQEFLRHKTLVHFINNQVVPYLFTYSYKQRYGVAPFGELSHGAKGIREFYQDLFSVGDHVPVLALLKILADKNYRGHLACACGGGLNLRRCHGKLLRELLTVQPAPYFAQDAAAILGSLTEDEVKAVHRGLLPKSILREFRRKSGEKIETAGRKPRQ
jgi:hypothetical protein